MGALGIEKDRVKSRPTDGREKGTPENPDQKNLPCGDPSSLVRNMEDAQDSSLLSEEKSSREALKEYKIA